MPELPETETIAGDLAGAVAGLRITGVDVIRDDVLRGSELAPEVLAGLTIQSVSRRAKTVVIELSEGYAALVTPRFTGMLQVRSSGNTGAEPYDVMLMTLSDGRGLVYNDVRRLGTVRIVDAAGRERFDRKLGVEPLGPDFTFERLSGILRGTQQPVKKALMDQTRIAGIGNIYSNEALWIAQIDPSRPASQLGDEEVRRLVPAIQDTLRAAIEARGTTFRDYRDAYGEQGGFAKHLQAYGRGGLACARCDTRMIETHAIDGRSTVFCFRCQL